MFVQPQDNIHEEGFGTTVESIMRCEDFKSNFARRLSNRYSSRSSLYSLKQDHTLKLRTPPTSANDVPERIEPCSQLSNNNSEQNCDATKPDEASWKPSEFQNTEVIALNMEVETLRWQLSQTEANRQMHIALLKQVVTFLNRVKKHIDSKRNDNGFKEGRVLPRSFNVADLPRSRSVVHVNRNSELSLRSPGKKMCTNKISKSISNVNGYKDNSGIWSHSKLSLMPENENGNKITEEILRLITLANTVLSTKLPDLACTYKHSPVSSSEENATKLIDNALLSLSLYQESSAPGLFPPDDVKNNTLKRETSFKTSTLSNENTQSKEFEYREDDLIKKNEGTESNFNCFMFDNMDTEKVNKQESDSEQTSKSRIFSTDKRNDYMTSTLIEDESGFSSLSSFQEIGIPIINIVPPSPCKEMGYNMEGIPDILEENEKWKTDNIELDKESLKVFWV